MIFAAILKFLLKPIIVDFENFVRMFVGGLLGKKNEHIRRFSTEVLMYILKKIRNKEDARNKFDIIFKMEFREDFHLELHLGVHNKTQNSELQNTDAIDNELDAAIEDEPSEDIAMDQEGSAIDQEGNDESKSEVSADEGPARPPKESFWTYEEIIGDFRACM